MLCFYGYTIIVFNIYVFTSLADKYDALSENINTKLSKLSETSDEISLLYNKAKLNDMVDSYVRSLDLKNLLNDSEVASKGQNVKLNGVENLPRIRIELGSKEKQAFETLINIDSQMGYTHENGKSNSQDREKPNIFLQVGNSEYFWLGLPLTLGASVKFPLTNTSAQSTQFQSRSPRHQKKYSKLSKGTKKIFVAKYPHSLQGGELNGWYRVEKACREAGWDMFHDGGFRALVTVTKRPISNILPRHMFKLPVVNLAGEILANSWQEFMYGRLANNQTRVIGMDGIIDDEIYRWNWKYYWIGDGFKRTCHDWTSSQIKDVASVLAFNYQGARIKRDVATCSVNLNLLCYSVCDEHDALI